MYRVFALGVAVAGLLVWLLVRLLAEESVDRAVKRDAVDKALNWAGYMSARIPDLPDLVDTGIPTEEQRVAIRQLRQLGDVFRFKLFNADGQLVLVSDEVSILAPAGIAAEFDPEPKEVVTRGEAIVDVFDGTEKADRPDLYAEAYVPLITPDGDIFGVAEVYVDETMTRQYFVESFEGFGTIVSALCALLFLVPAVAYGIQRTLAQQSRSEAEYLAKFDVLTGLLNRGEFRRRAEALMAEDSLSALLFLDADKFKAINDTHGHAVGDRYLEQIGRNLTSITDAGDLVARFGGDEFVIAMKNVNKEMVVRRVRTILTLCAKPLEVGERKLKGTVSIGVAMPEPGAALDEVIADADAALYSAKSAGRNQYALYGKDMGEEVRRRHMLEQRISEAVYDEDFTLQYQPLVDGETRAIVGYEALLRLKLHDGSEVPPAEFIPLAETMGLIDQLGEWVLRRATADIAVRRGSPRIAINLSAAQFRSGRLPALIADALQASGLEAERLELEITESLLLEDDVSIAFQIDALQEMGVRIAMDDFGTGFSSLGYLWKFGFDRIKIDRSFVAGLLDNSERSQEIIETVILLGKRLDMQVTAEGVETEEQSKILSRLGCNVLQGFLFGEPAPLSDAAADELSGTALLTDERSAAH